MGNNPLNFFKYWKKHGWKKTIADLTYNYFMLETPQQILKKQIIGYIGTISGTIFMIIFLFIKGLWYVTIAAGFSILIQYSMLKQALKQKQILKDIENISFEESELSE